MNPAVLGWLVRLLLVHRLDDAHGTYADKLLNEICLMYDIWFKLEVKGPRKCIAPSAQATLQEELSARGADDQGKKAVLVDRLHALLTAVEVCRLHGLPA